MVDERIEFLENLSQSIFIEKISTINLNKLYEIKVSINDHPDRYCESINWALDQYVDQLSRIISLDLSGDSKNVKSINNLLKFLHLFPNLHSLNMKGLTMNDSLVISLCKNLSLNSLTQLKISIESFSLRTYAYLSYYLEYLEDIKISSQNHLPSPSSSSYLYDYIRLLCELPFDDNWRQTSLCNDDQRNDHEIINSIIHNPNSRNLCFKGWEYLHLPYDLFSSLLQYEITEKKIFPSIRALELSGYDFRSICELLDNHSDLFPNVNHLIIKSIQFNNSVDNYLFSILKRFLQLDSIKRLLQKDIQDATTRATLDITQNPLENINHLQMIKYIFDIKKFSFLANGVSPQTNSNYMVLYNKIYCDFFGNSRYDQVNYILDLSFNNNKKKISNYEWNLISLIFPYLGYISKIDLSGYDINTDEGQYIFERIGRLPPTVISLNLSNCKFKSLPSLLLNHRILLQELNLSNNEIMNVSLYDLNNFIRHSSKLQSIDLTFNRELSESIIWYLCLCNSPNLKELKFFNSSIDPMITYYQNSLTIYQKEPTIWNFFKNNLQIVDYVDKDKLILNDCINTYQNEIYLDIHEHEYIFVGLLFSLIRYNDFKTIDLRNYFIPQHSDMQKYLILLLKKLSNDKYKHLTIEVYLSVQLLSQDFQTELHSGFLSILIPYISKNTKLFINNSDIEACICLKDYERDEREKFDEEGNIITERIKRTITETTLTKSKFSKTYHNNS